MVNEKTIETMPKISRLQRKGHKFYCRVTVPKDLREVVGRTEIVRALGTGQHRLAVERCRRVSAEIDAELAEAWWKLRPLATLTEHDIKQMAMLWLHRAERRAEAEVAEGIGTTEALDNLDADVGDLLDRDDPVALASVQAAADRLLKEAGAEPDRSGAEYRLLVGLVRRAMVETARRSIDRLKGDFSGRTYDALFNGVSAGAPAPEPPGIALTVLVARYMADLARAGASAKTRLDSDFAFRALTELLGECTPARDVTRAGCRRVRDVLSKLPPNATKRFLGEPLERAARRAEARGLRALAPRTVNAYLSKLSALFKWAEREGYVDKNPAVGLRAAEPEGDQRGARRSFSTEQLRLVFNAPLYTGCQNDGAGFARRGPNVVRRGRFWVPLLVLFTGMRLNEVCRLGPDDVETRDGVPVILVRVGGDGTRVKTAAVLWVVPVHPELVKIGFLTFAEARQAAGYRRLFPELKQDRRGYCSGPFQKWFSRFLRHCGAYSRSTTFDSFRHCFRDALREADVGREATLVLGGWARAGVSDTVYGEALRPSTLAREMAKVRYDVDLSHLLGFVAEEL